MKIEGTHLRVLGQKTLFQLLHEAQLALTERHHAVLPTILVWVAICICIWKKNPKWNKGSPLNSNQSLTMGCGHFATAHAHWIKMLCSGFEWQCALLVAENNLGCENECFCFERTLHFSFVCVLFPQTGHQDCGLCLEGTCLEWQRVFFFLLRKKIWEGVKMSVSV